MGEAIITRAASFKSGESAILRVKTTPGSNVSCTNGQETQTGLSTGSNDFHVGYGKWLITGTYEGKTLMGEIVVDTLKIYDLNLKHTTYGILIDMNVSDPTSAVSYIDDAVGMTPLSCNLYNGACNYGSWETVISNWMGCKPCLYSNGKRVAYLNKNNYGQKADGSAADISSGSAGDVMIEFTSLWYKFSSPNSTTLKFEVCDYDRTTDGFVQAAFLSEDGSATIRDQFYYGVYNGYVESSKLRSLSGKTPTANISYNDSILRAAQNHNSCTIETLFKRVYILGLLMMVTKSRGIQSKIGHGVVANACPSPISTGTMNSNGLFYGRNDNSSGVKCFGIENMWGNISNWMAGLVTNNTSGGLGFKSCAPYSPDGINYVGVNTYFTSGYPTRCSQFADGAIMLPTDLQGNNTMGWPDHVYAYSEARKVAFVGGNWGESLADVGPFYLTIAGSSAYPDSRYAPRLVAS